MAIERSHLRLILSVVLAVLFGLAALGPAFGAGTGAFEERYPRQGLPQECTQEQGYYQNPTFLPDLENSNFTASTVTAVYQRTSNTSQYRVVFNISETRNSTFRVGLNGDGAIINSTGFRKTGTRFRWDGDNRNASITVEINPDDSQTYNPRDTNRSYPSGDRWLLGPALDLAGGNVSVRPASAGAIGEQFVYLGNVSVSRQMIGCQEHVFVQPNISRESSVSPATVLSVLNESSRRLHGGKTDQTVRVFASPTVPQGDHPGWAVANEFIAPAEYSSGSPEEMNIWFHEYVHTRQDFRVTGGLQWFTEGSAQYLGLRLQLESGYMSPREYDGMLARYREVPNGTALNQADATSKRSYLWGAALLSDLDHRLSESNQTVGSLITHLNNRGFSMSGTAEQWVNQQTEPTSSRENRYQFRNQVFSSAYPNVSYTMGPDWLPWQARAILASLEAPLGRLLSALFSVAFLVQAHRLRTHTEPTKTE